MSYSCKMPEATGDFAKMKGLIENIELELDALAEYNSGTAVKKGIKSSLDGVRLCLASLQCFHNAGSILKREASND